MKKIIYIFLFSLITFSGNFLLAANGDTTYLKPFDKVSFNHYGNFDKWAVFPSPTKKSQRIFMKYTVGCESNGQCEWDYTNTIYVRQNTGTKDSSLQKATTFTVNGAVKDSFNYSTDTTWVTNYNASTKKTDSISSTPLTIIHFQFVSALQPQVPIDTIKVFPVQYYKYHFDSTGKKTDSIFVAVKQTIKAVYTNYYLVFDKIIDYEMGRMITPYAKFFPKNFAYEYLYDVTDYASLLHDSVQIRMNYSGYSWGFVGTIEFFMIEGTPAREAYKVANLWNGYFAYGNASDPIDNHLQPVSFTKSDSLTTVKLRMTISGHGSDGTQCCEFQPKNYYVKLNNNQFAQNQIWKDDCGSNPITAQGGTWIYNRANWCPGMIINPYQYNLNAVSGNNTIDVDMEDYTNTGAGGYAYGSQLIYYKNNAYNLDAGIETILAPTKYFIYNRTNAICDNGKILLRNFGIQTITTAIIKYQVGDGEIQTYTWYGSIAFDEKTEVVLPNIIWANPSSSKTFKVWIDKTNWQVDENPFNNTLSSTFDFPMVLPLTFVVETTTNLHPEENSYTIKTYWGHTVFSKIFSKTSTLHRDTITLGYGCYTFEFLDSGGDGLSFFANSSGNGSLRLVKTPISQGMIKSFNADFGNFISFNFRAGSQVGVDEVNIEPSSISIYPQPANDKVIIQSEKMYITQAQIICLDGRVIKSFNETETIAGELNIADINTGIYLLNLKGSNGEQVVKKLCVVK